MVNWKQSSLLWKSYLIFILSALGIFSVPFKLLLTIQHHYLVITNHCDHSPSESHFLEDQSNFVIIALNLSFTSFVCPRLNQGISLETGSKIRGKIPEVLEW